MKSSNNVIKSADGKEKSKAWNPLDISSGTEVDANTQKSFVGSNDSLSSDVFSPGFNGTQNESIETQSDQAPTQFFNRAGVIKAGAADNSVGAWIPKAIEPKPEVYGTQIPNRTSSVQTEQLDGKAEQKKEIRQLRLQVQKIIEDSQIQASEIVHQSREQAVQISYQAYKDGFENGRAAAEEEMTALISSVRSIVEEARNWHQEILTYSERAVIDLVEDIAKTIFCDGVTLEPDLLGKVFRRALSEAKTLGDLRIHVNPEDEAAMHPHWAKEQASMIGQRIEMIPDRSIKRGGCMIEGKYGSVDARVETQYKAAIGAISDVAELNGVQE